MTHDSTKARAWESSFCQSDANLLTLFYMQFACIVTQAPQFSQNNIAVSHPKSETIRKFAEFGFYLHYFKT